ncbi:MULTISPECIES: rod shape-determining protein MreD [unclassified Idiomarina]|jgi:rod shape-determining protein MreD|uniref:rod shape-determining protein MreD n=1 Tax=unclassified Idiomarina TaxID=2614829 RepID=UPI0008F80C6F|nr:MULTISPECIES: rod shape-determining protein MreD [unclassified Idiomarina]NQZ03266.1 rod shape-determining protein MreD [Idiomarina sp.]OIM99267.1 rod shape-determining protein MreD [Idiomarina sp. MD25a]|tara:strand:+ start:212 stop:691 length:480 start_codon:yes stop_codon:yes gene_type:complete
MFKHGLLPLVLTYLVAMILMVMPMPASIDVYRPDWVTLVLLYWIIALPHRVSIGTALVLGVLTDILLGSVLGVHALGMVVVSYFAARHFQRIRNFSLPQQVILIAFLVLIKRLIVFQANVFIHDAQFTSTYFWPALTSALFWFWLFPLLRKIRRRFGVV